MCVDMVLLSLHLEGRPKFMRVCAIVERFTMLFPALSLQLFAVQVGVEPNVVQRSTVGVVSHLTVHLQGV